MIPAIDKASAFDVTADIEPAVAASGGLRLMGWSARETDGAPATARIVRGAAVSGGTPVALLELAAGASVSQWYGPQGLAAPEGLAIDHIAGELEVTLHWTA